MAPVSTVALQQLADNYPKLFRAASNELSRPLRSHPWYDPIKRGADIVIAMVGLVLAAPVIGVASLMVKLTSRGPAFYCKARVGRHKQLFRIIKIRTMVDDCEAMSGPCWSRHNDSRITAIGRFLRRFHLDELPQLLNVLFGHMSLVGPRPERPEFIPVLEQAVPHFGARLEIRPGVTGLAQVQLPPDSDLVGVERKLTHDLYYLDNRSAWLDFRILLCTAFKLLHIRYSVSRMVLRMPKPNKLSGLGSVNGKLGCVS
jgi:lipopolysaccharide/colanic/teichoic acid biosynthesis glycosyltransferase